MLGRRGVIQHRVRVIRFAGIFLGIAGLTAGIFCLFYFWELTNRGVVMDQMGFLFFQLYCALLVPIGLGSWLLSRFHETRQLAEEDLNRQNKELAREMSERKQAELDLRESEEKFRTICEIAPVMIDSFDQNACCTLWNRECVKRLGWTMEELQGHGDPLRLLYPDPQVYQTVLETIAAADGVFREYQVVAKNGTNRCQSWVNFQLPDGTQMSAGYDITERKEAEIALKASEERFQLAVAGSTDGVWDWNILTDEVYLAPRFKELIGYEDHEIKDSFSIFESRLHENDFGRVMKAMHDHLKHRIPYDITYRLCTKTGQFRWFRARGQAIWDNVSNPIRMAGSITDIEDLKQAEEELTRHRDHLEDLVRKRTEQLEETQKKLVRKERLAAVGQLTATVSHEIRNPLAAMRAAVSVVGKVAKDKDPLLKSSIEILDRSISRCDKVVDDMLDFTRVKDLDLKRTNFDKWIGGVMEEFQFRPDITVETKLECAAMIELDSDRLRRAVLNVLQNACDAMDEEEVQGTKIRRKILSVRTRLKEKKVELIIKDNGIGIAKGDQEKIFEPLYSSKSYGVGLGLPTVKQILEQHSGGIEIYSQANQGTQVILWLPREQEKEEPIL